MADEQTTLEALLSTAQEQLRWHRAAVLPQVRTTIEEALTTSQLRKAYELCDGERTMREIAAASEASVGSIGGWTKQWRDLGIAFENSDGRVEHLVSLSSLGIQLIV